MKTCKFEDCESLTEGNTDYCGTHNRIMRKSEQAATKEAEKRIDHLLKLKAKKQKTELPKQSAKMIELLKEYSKKKAIWIKGKRCAVYPERVATDVHHMKSRGLGYADKWAEQNNIPLLLDKRFWLPVSREGHIKIEKNPQWAKANGYSVSRLAKDL